MICESGAAIRSLELCYFYYSVFFFFLSFVLFFSFVPFFLNFDPFFLSFEPFSLDSFLMPGNVLLLTPPPHGWNPVIAPDVNKIRERPENSSNRVWKELKKNGSEGYNGYIIVWIEVCSIWSCICEVLPVRWTHML